MSSMVSKSHIKLQDLAPFLRGYDSKSPETAQDWAKGQSSGFTPGMLIFCLEKVAAAPGLAVGRKDEAGDSYRVRDLCIVVGEDGGRPLVVNITASAYELRFLEVLMYEKAKKAILDEKDFSFTAVRPIQKLEQSKIEEIEQLGAVYAQGGSRRSLVVDATAPQEPAMALLSSLGVKLTMIGIGKQALDIGYVCLLLFGPEGRTEDKNRAQVRSAFVPIPLTEPLGTKVASSQPPQAATVWQGPLPGGEVQVPPGSESLLSGVQQTVNVENEASGWGSTDFGGDSWATAPEKPSQTRAGAEGGASQYSFTPPAGSPPSASWQPPATAIPDFAFAPQPASTFPAPPMDFQEQLSHQTEFEQHLGAAKPQDTRSTWDDPSAPGVAEWGDSTPPVPAAPAAGTPASSWTQPASNAPSVSDWGAPPSPLATPAPDWAASSAGGDWGAPPAAVPEVGKWSGSSAPSSGDWGAPPAPMPAVSAGDWGSQPVQASANTFAQPDSAEIAAQSQSGSWSQSATPVGTTPGTGSWNTPWAQGSAGDPAATPAPLPEIEEDQQTGEGDTGAPIPKKDANLFNRLYQQLAKGSPGASATNLPQMNPEGSLGPEQSTSPNASQTNLPRLSQELLSRTTAPQSPNASSTNLQPMDPELAAHFRIPSPPPGAVADDSLNAPANQTPAVPEQQNAPSFDWGSPAAEPSTAKDETTESTGETGNEAPSWLESLDRKKATPFAPTQNLKPPTVNPSQRKAPGAGARQNNDFEMDLPTDLEGLRETGKIKMTPSMKDAVKRKSEVAAKLNASASKPSPSEPASIESNTGTRSTDLNNQLQSIEANAVDEPQAVDSEVEAAAVEPTAEISPADAVTQTISESVAAIQPKLSTEEDPYKHLAEALSGLMSIDDEQAEASKGVPTGVSVAEDTAAQTTAESAPAPAINKPFELKDLHDPSPASTTSEGLSRSYDPLSSNSPSLLGGAPDDTETTSSNISSTEEKTESAAPAQSNESRTPSPERQSRFAAMEAAFGTHGAPPIKPLSIDSQPAITTGSSEAFALAEEAAPEQPEEEELNESQLVDISGVQESETVPAARPPVQESVLGPDTDFLITTRTDVPVLNDMHTTASPLDALDPEVLITSASDIPSLGAARAASSAVPSTGADATTATTAAEVSPVKPAASKATFQEPRLVMNEMVTLMNKLEQQVSKAAKKVSSRSEEIKQRLNKQVDDLIFTASQVENQNQIVVQDTTAKLSKSLDSSTDDARQNISDITAGGRYAIKQMLTTNQQAVDDTKTKLLEDLTRACDDFRKESESLTQECETFLGQFVKDKTDLIDATLKEITGRLDETNASFLAKITARFERFKERMNDEASSIGRSLERNVHSMFEEIDGSWDRASEKLKLTKSEFEQTILHSVKTVELSASQNTRQILISSMAPQLRERTRRLLDLKDSQTKQFMSDTVAQSSLQLQGLESSLAAARQQLHTLVEDCVSNLDGVGRGQQAGLEEIFKSASSKTEKLTSEVQLAIQDAQSRVHETELVCKKLAENSSVDTDADLTDERAATTQAIQRLKSQCNSQLQTSLEDACMRLEQMSQKVQNEATAHRMQLTQGSRENSESGLNRIREAMQEAFSAIQSAREQNME